MRARSSLRRRFSRLKDRFLHKVSQLDGGVGESYEAE